MKPVLRCVNLSKNFGALPVLRQLSFAVAPGEGVGVTAGPGGGKSVLATILAGSEAPSQGEVYINGQRMRWPFRPRAVGISVIHQEPELVEWLDITANIFLGEELGWPVTRGLRLLDPGRMDQRAREVLAQLDIHFESLREPVAHLSSEERQLVAIARTLIRPARLVVVDEPTLALNYAYQQKLLTLMRDWQQAGTAVLFCSNNLDHLFAVCQRIVVLRQGNGVADLRTEATDREDVVAALVGTTDRQQLTPIIWALESYYRAREQAQQLGRQRTQLEQNLATQIAALDMANLALQDAHRRLLTEREQERKALARELHDQVIQDLLSVNYELEEIASEAPTQVDNLAGELGDVRDSIRALVDDLRRICGTLRPPTIDSLGVGAALQSYTRDWSARTGIPVTVALDKQLGRLPEPLELSIFRIIQEGLNNVRKHAQATAVQIGLRRTALGSLTLTIADNGRGLPPGFDLATLAAGGHFGVLGISERVALVEGRMRLENQATGGALLQVEIPDPQGRAERVGSGARGGNTNEPAS